MNNNAETQTTLASWALAIERALQKEGADNAAIFAAAGIDKEHLRQPEARIPVTTMWRLWREAVAATGNEAIGIRVAETIFPTHLNALMFALQASSTLQDCIERMVRYARVVSTIGMISIEYGEQQVAIRMHSSEQPERPFQPVDALMAVVVKVIRDILEPDDYDCIQSIHLSRPEPDDRLLFDQFFACPILFSSENNKIILDAAAIESPLPSANSELARVNDQILNEYLQRMNNETTSLRVRKEIMRLLGTEHLNQEYIASSLNMSARNLHRKLADESNSFKELLDSIRHELALGYLEVSNMSIGELTFTLGFVDQSSFSRAFKRWTGMTPSQYRKTRATA